MKISGNQVYLDSAQDILSLKFCKDLHKMNVNFCFPIVEKDKSVFESRRSVLKQIQSAHFDYIDNLWEFEYLPNLKNFSFNECYNLRMDSNVKLENITSFILPNMDSIQLVKMFPNLKTLSVRNNDARIVTTEPNVDYDKILNELTNLKELNIERNGNIKSLDLSGLKQLDKLRIIGNYYLNEIKLNENLEVGELQIFDNGEKLDEVALLKPFVLNHISGKADCSKLVASVFVFNKLRKSLERELENPIFAYIFQKNINYAHTMNRKFMTAMYDFDEMLKLDKDVESIFQKISIDKSNNQFEKFIKIYGWIIQNTKYDVPRYSNLQNISDRFVQKFANDYWLRNVVGKVGTSNNLMGAVEKQGAVCEGYTYALKFMLDKCGIESHKVYAVIENGGGVGNFDFQKYPNHVLSKVILNGKALYCDVTFDQKRFEDYRPEIKIKDACKEVQKFLDITNNKNADREVILESVFKSLQDMYDCKTIIGETFDYQEYEKSQDDKQILRRENARLLKVKEKIESDYLILENKKNFEKSNEVAMEK